MSHTTHRILAGRDKCLRIGSAHAGYLADMHVLVDHERRLRSVGKEGENSPNIFEHQQDAEVRVTHIIIF